MARASSVIKASAAAGLTQARLQSFRLNDIMEEARHCVADAHAQADAMIAEARRRADSLREEARTTACEQGYRDGYEKGLAEGREAGRREAFEAASREFAEQQAGLVETCRRIISAVNEDRRAWREAARQDLVDLAMAIARRVAHHDGAEHRETVLRNLEEAVRIVGARSEVTIAVSPADVEAARAFARSLLDMKEQWRDIRVLTEPEISPGGCRVHWGSGSIDATLETQLDRITAELNGGMPKGQ